MNHNKYIHIYIYYIMVCPGCFGIELKVGKPIVSSSVYQVMGRQYVPPSCPYWPHGRYTETSETRCIQCPTQTVLLFILLYYTELYCTYTLIIGTDSLEFSWGTAEYSKCYSSGPGLQVSHEVPN